MTGIIHSLLDTDLYKFTMAQLAFHQYRKTQVKYQFVCRNKGVDLNPYLKEINEEIKLLCQKKFTEDEIQYLREQGIFKEDFLKFLKKFKLKTKQVKIFVKRGKLNIEAQGTWCETIFWEVFLLSIVNEVYFRNTHPEANRCEGLRRLYAKVEQIKELNKVSLAEGWDLLKLSDFGTRRRYSFDWQLQVNQVLKQELPDNFNGTSSVYIAKLLNLRPIGTFAHELYQAFQALSPNLRDFQVETLKAWYKEYDGKSAIALSDIIGSDAFLKDFDKEWANKYYGTRHDSGDPKVYSDKMIAHYEKLGINPKDKVIVFSDGLNVPAAIDIYMYNIRRTNPIFGIGTNLTNDFGFPALNIVMKMVECDGKPVIKISDEYSKAIGDKGAINKIIQTFQIKMEPFDLELDSREKELWEKADSVLHENSGQWMETYLPQINSKPIDTIKDEKKFQESLNILGRIEHGVYS